VVEGDGVAVDLVLSVVVDRLAFAVDFAVEVPLAVLDAELQDGVDRERGIGPVVLDELAEALPTKGGLGVPR
jgi:hypothetical protein